MYKDEDYKGKVVELILELANRYGLRVVWNNFIAISACLVSSMGKESNLSRNERLSKLQKRYTLPDMKSLLLIGYYSAMALKDNPSKDFLGDIFCHLKLNNYGIEYPIRLELPKISDSKILQEVREKGYYIIEDPLCGTGDRLLPMVYEVKKLLEKNGYNAHRYITVVGYENDEIKALMCYLQLTAIGASGYIKIGTPDPSGTLADDRGDCWFTPMYLF